MPTKLTDLTELVVAPAGGDFLHIVDVDDPIGGGAGTSKKITVDHLTSTVTNDTTIRGFTNNKTASATNWLGYNYQFYPHISVDFGFASTANFDVDWSDIIPAAVCNLTHDQTLTYFQGVFISSNAATVDLSLWFVRPLCLGATKGTLRHITTITKTTTGGYDCFSQALGQSLVKGDIILPLLKTSTNTLVKFVGNFTLTE